MKSIIQTKTFKLKNEIIEYIGFLLKINNQAIKGLKKPNIEKTNELLTDIANSTIKADFIIQNCMYLLTQNPLGKELRKVVSFQFMAKLINQIILNLNAMVKFGLNNNDDFNKSSIIRINKMNNLFLNNLNILLIYMNAENAEKEQLLLIVDNNVLITKQLKNIILELKHSFVKYKDKNEAQIQVRLTTYSICESIERNSKKINSIVEYLLFIESGKNHTFNF